MDKKILRPELLCPAGSPLAFAAAIEGGADAIYVGGTAFNARINARNFTKEELTEAIKLAHAYGVKVYVAANTLIYDNEKNDFLMAAEEAYLCGADALIVADLGMAEQIRRKIPIELHGSTQMSGHSTAAAELLANRGFSRMVCARELCRDDLRTLVTASPIETEVFVHGALCVCASGQCLFSSLVGGRSGNRGECAQPCRLPFKNKGGNEYPLSLKDLSLASHVRELCDMGIASFKIEGRMKTPEYVRDVAATWRRLIDEGRNATAEELCELAEVFSRGGFTDGYYTRKISSKMLGVRSKSDKKSSRELKPFEKITRKLPLYMEARFAVGEPISLTVRTGEKSATAFGVTAEAAVNAPMSREAIEKNLKKLGATPYEAKGIEIELYGELMVPISAINALRRRAIDALTAEEPRQGGRLPTAPEDRRSFRCEAGNSAYFHSPHQIPKNAKEFFDIIYLPLEKYDGSTNGACLPPIIYDSELPAVRRLLQNAKALGCEHILVGNIGHIALARESGMYMHGDFRLNAANSFTAAELEADFEDIILSPELTMPMIRDIHRAFPFARPIIYGRIPLMVTEKCVGKELRAGKTDPCTACSSGSALLTDRRGVSFPVLRGYEHRSIIVNSVPTYMADRLSDLKSRGISHGHFIFTTEAQSEVSQIISAYITAQPPVAPIRRIK